MSDETRYVYGQHGGRIGILPGDAAGAAPAPFIGNPFPPPPQLNYATLLDELKARRDKQSATAQDWQKKANDAYSRLADLQIAIAALEPLAEDAPKDDGLLEASTLQDAQHSIQGACEEAPVPGTGEESRDHSDDASEFAESDSDAGFDAPKGQTHFDEAAEALAREERPPLTPLTDPIWNEPEPTKPEADSIAKALDHYDPKAMAERERFNPFNIFKREGDQ